MENNSLREDVENVAQSWNQPGTSGWNTIKMEKAATTTKRKLRAAKPKKEPVKSRKLDHYSPPVTRNKNYAKLTAKEKRNLQSRILAFHQTDEVLPEEIELVHPREFKSAKPNARKNPVRECHKQNLSLKIGTENVRTNCSSYGIGKCLCCNGNKAVSPHEVPHNLTSHNTCILFGVSNCDCCPRTMHSHSSELDHLSVSQMEPASSIETSSAENSNVDDVKLPTRSLPKNVIIEKFFESFTHDRVDYAKPKKKNIVEGLIHDPASYYSEHLSKECDIPEKTILQRVDFKRALRTSRHLAKSCAHATDSTPLPGFRPFEFMATSTPIQLPNLASSKTQQSPIEGDLSVNSPERPAETVNNLFVVNESVGVEPLIDSWVENQQQIVDLPEDVMETNTTELCDLLHNIIEASVDVEPETDAVDEETTVTKPLVEMDDLLTIDRSFVTIRTPYKPRHSIEDCDAIREEDIMDFVNDLVASEEESIIQECELRCKRLLESRANTNRPIGNLAEAIEIFDDDIHDSSVQILEINSDEGNSVEFVSEGNIFDEFERNIPSTSNPPCNKPTTKKNKKRKKGAYRRQSKPTDDIKVKSEAPSIGEVEGAEQAFKECSICLEVLSRTKEISSTTCGHIFCTSCIKSAITTSKNCPNCRKPLTLKKIHPIFLF